MPRLSASATIAALLALGLRAQITVAVSRYDSAGTSANTLEKILNPSNVKQSGFGKLYSYYVDGAVYAQPLYFRNTLYVSTMNDKIYAFDPSKPGPPLWMRDLTNELSGVTPVPVTHITNNNDLNLVGNVGIEGTPVIDPESNAMFFVARTVENGTYVQRIHKLDLRDGKDLLPAQAIEASVASSAEDATNGILRFDPTAGHQRTALALVDGAVIVAWASHEDIRPYHGWVMAFDAKSLRRRAAWCVTPDGADGGIWQSGRGPAVDKAGNIYFETGNGDWNGRRNFGTSLVKLKLAGGSFEVADYFTPHNFEDLNKRDADLGSTGPMLVPGTPLLVAGSKKGILYLFDTSKLGRNTPGDAGPLATVDVKGGRIMAGPAYWNQRVYLWCEADVLKGFRLADPGIETAPFAKGAIANHGSPGGTLTISSDANLAGTAIVWATHTNNKSADHGNAPGILRAFDASTLQELWNSEQAPKRDRLGTLVKFVPPLVVEGRVYVPNYDNAVNVYGLLSR
jgi:hypothetical protein